MKKLYFTCFLHTQRDLSNYKRLDMSTLVAALDDRTPIPVNVDPLVELPRYLCPIVCRLDLGFVLYRYEAFAVLKRCEVFAVL